MMITMYGAVKGYYSKEFKLTISQRTLMLQTISFMTYLLLGALTYSKLEGWKFLDAVYWADFTLLTIGIGGDYTPQTHTGRGLLFPFAIGGIIVLGLVVDSVRSLVLERGKKKMGARMIEKIRRRVVNRIEKARNSNDRFFHKIRGLDKKTSCVLSLDPHENRLSEKRQREAEFNGMRQVQKLATKERKWINLIVSGLAWLFLWLVGAAVFYKAERNQQWTYFESIYFSYTTLLTIGYGDFQPESNSGKPFFVFWSLLAIPTLTILISNMSDTVIAGIKDLTIYLGEITVLPSEKGSVQHRLQFGITKVTGGKLNLKAFQDSNDSDIEERQPGLVHMPHRQHQKPEHDKKDVEAINNLTRDFAEAEKLDEDDAKKHGDKLAEDIHHYRHILITEIKNVYGDVNAPIPKKYTYDEWSYYLGILGEDEGNPKHHLKAPLKSDHADLMPVKDEATAPAKPEIKKEAEESAGQKHAKPEADDQSEGIKTWSWMGNRSLLMGDKGESEWILKKLLLRLEDELQYEKMLAAKLRKKQKEDPNASEQDNLQAIMTDHVNNMEASRDAIRRESSNKPHMDLGESSISASSRADST
jgi:potassium channel subfamily K, other eukaryote